jgi:hypothetical protein
LRAPQEPQSKGFFHWPPTPLLMDSYPIFPMVALSHTCDLEMVAKFLWPGNGDRKMALMPLNLRLEAPDGSFQEEYRIQGADIEVRTGPPSVEFDSTDDGSRDEWHRVSAEQLSAHVHGNTVVAQWLRHRIGWRRLVLACTEPRTLETFGVSTNSHHNSHWA